jgi:hypothetical protein
MASACLLQTTAARFATIFAGLSNGPQETGMGFHGRWRSMSGTTMLFVILAAVYYLVLNAVLVNEIIEQVRTGPQPSAAARSHSSLATSDPRDPSPSCRELASIDRDICSAEVLAGKASARFRERLREERGERRAAREERGKTPAPSALADASHREIAATAR